MLKSENGGPLAACLAAFLLAAPAGAATRPTFDKAAVERGKTQFVSSCGFCHGNDATGNRAPDLVRSPLVNRDKKGDLIAPVIHDGRPDKGMPAIPLPQNKVDDIVTFLHFRVQEGLNSAGVPHDYPVEKLLTGNAEAGRAYFEGAGGCSKCHSVTGDLKGVAGKYTPLMLQHAMLAPKGAAPTVVVTLPGGSKVEGVLLHEDEFDIAIRAKDDGGGGWYRSWPRSKVQVQIHDPLEAHRELMSRYTDADMHNLFAYLVTLK
ncbi:MAG TPA: c-type cytochrome [Bryobacteraceae bacterium]|jgi:cytochrome c oxidase cbb3-type subunit 3|nr:c-type cytochrome [Bryobacteraceae bacterium]